MSASASIWIGFDPREADAFAVCRASILRHLTLPIPIHGLVLGDLQARQLHTRPMSRVDGQLIDLLSRRADYSGAISTEHANARFFVPYIARSGWALFMDGDMLVRTNIARVFERLDSKYAVYCVKHDHRPSGARKMDGQLQTIYERKNWSSFAIFNCDHPANKSLTLELLNRLPGRDLHRFCWLDESEIGALDPAWNVLVGHSDPAIEPHVVHFTSGTPAMPGYESAPYADVWRQERDAWARGREW